MMFEGKLTQNIVEILKNFESGVLNDLFQSCFIYRNHVGRVQYQNDKGFYGEVIFVPRPTKSPQWEKDNVYQLFKVGHNLNLITNKEFGKPFQGESMEETFKAFTAVVDESIEELENKLQKLKGN